MLMETTESSHKPEFNILADAYLGNRQMLLSKLNFLANLAQKEQWDYHGSSEKQILYN